MSMPLRAHSLIRPGIEMSMTDARTCLALISCSIRSVSLTPPMRKYSTVVPDFFRNICAHSSQASDADAEYQKTDCWAPTCSGARPAMPPVRPAAPCRNSRRDQGAGTLGGRPIGFSPHSHRLLGRVDAGEAAEGRGAADAVLTEPAG